jgi:hypothetical protein
MRKIVHYEERICDQCGKLKKHTLNETYFGIIDPFEGWLDIHKRPTSMMDEKSTKDFCSLSCLENYLRGGKKL